MSRCRCVKKGADERFDWAVSFADALRPGDIIVAAQVPIIPGLVASVDIQYERTLARWIAAGEQGTSINCPSRAPPRRGAYAPSASRCASGSRRRPSGDRRISESLPRRLGAHGHNVMSNCARKQCVAFLVRRSFQPLRPLFADTNREPSLFLRCTRN